MSWPSKIKYYLTLVTIASFFIAGGVEYSTFNNQYCNNVSYLFCYYCVIVFLLSPGVIIPTCWNYMHDNFGAEKWFYGLTLAAMSISNFIMGPLMGALYDRTHEPKYIVLFLNLFEIGGELKSLMYPLLLCMYPFLFSGNFMYFAASSKYMILASRFLTGMDEWINN